MKNCLIAMMIGIVAWCNLSAQPNVRNFYMYNVDTSAFPRVTANVYVLDNANQRYKNLSVTDFDLFENGSQRDATMTLNCDTSTTPLPIAVCLALDQSFSMANKTPAGDTYWDWVKAGARAFIDSLRMTPPTCVAITSFGGTAYVRAPFQTTKPPLYTALDQIPIEGGTNYDEAFLNLSAPSQSAAAVTVLRNAPAMLKRYIIILTDGQPDKPPSKQRIIDSCIANGITVYAINLYTTKTPNINADLQEIATKTNGRAFLARSKADLVSIYKLIILEAQRNIDCRLSWLSTPGCTPQSRQRTLRAVFRKGTITYTWNGAYTASINSLANPIPSVSTLSFSDPGSGAKVRKTLTVRAPLGNTIRIDRFVSALPGVFSVISTSKPLPCTLSGTQTIDVIIEFTQTTTGTLHKSTLDIQGSPCSQSVALNVIIPVLKLVTPVGGELLNGCDTIPIKWSGIEEDEAITVMYSRDNGVRWNVLDNLAYGLSYSWFNNLEHDAGTQVPYAYKVKVERSTPRWLARIGGANADTASCISYSKGTTLLSVGGSFEGTMNFGTAILSSSGGKDAFVTSMNVNGVPRSALRIGGPGDDNVVALASDSTTNTIIAGVTTGSTVMVGDSSMKFSTNNRYSSFVAKLDSSGKIVWVVGIGDTTGLNRGQFRATGVSVKPDSTIILQGYTLGVVSSLYTSGTQAAPIEHDAPQVSEFPVTVEITKRGVVKQFLDGFFQPASKSAATAVLVANDSYQVGTFSGTTTAGRFTQSSQGSSDGFVRAVSLNAGIDQSAKSFRIQAPLVIFEVQQLDLPSVEVGTSRNFYVGQPMRSAGSVALELAELSSVGQDSLDFSVVPQIAPGVIQPFSSPEVRVTVTPQPVARRQRYAYLVARAACSEPAFIRLRTYATFPSLSMTSLDFGRRRIGSVQTDTIFLTNADAGTIGLQGLKDSANGSKSYSYSAPIPSDSLLKGKTTLPIAVRFSPKQIEPDSLVLRIDSSGTVPVPVRGAARGSGFLPRSRSTGYRFMPVIVGQSSMEPAFVRIDNADSIAPLRVYAHAWAGGLSGDFKAGLNSADSTIAVGDSLVVPIGFTPTKPGLQTVLYVFEHDAAPGPDALPRARDTVVVEGDAVDVRVQPQQINFPTILRCDSSSASFRVSNLASQTDVHIRQIRLEGDTTEFVIQQVAPDTIAAGADVVISVAYKPTAMASAAARVIIIHDGGDADTVNLRAASTTATLQLSASDTTMTARIDDKLLININGIVKSSSAFELDTISVHVQTHPAQARFATERFSSVQNGWTWRIDSMNTTYGFYGSWSGGPQPSYLRLLSLPFDMYLSIDQKNIMSVSGVAANAAACLTIDSGTIIINEAPVCFLGGGAIQLTSPLALQVVARSEFLDVQFSTPTSTPVQCQIVSAVGSILYSTIIPAKAGFNSVSIPLHSLPAGVFFCRIVAENSLTAKGFVHMR